MICENVGIDVGICDTYGLGSLPKSGKSYRLPFVYTRDKKMFKDGVECV